MRARSLLGALLLVVGAVRRGPAQVVPYPTGFAAYSALVSTPVGGLPPLATSTIAGTALASPLLTLRYGFVSDVRAALANPGVAGTRSVGQLAASLTLPVTLGSTISATVGAGTGNAFVRRSSPTGSLAADVRLLERRFGQADSPMRLTVGVNGEVGAARSVVAGSIGVPVGFVLGAEGQGTRFVPFITPAFGITRTTGVSYDFGESARFLVGGGMGVTSPIRTVSASLGFQYVLLDRAVPQVGVAVSIGGR